MRSAQQSLLPQWHTTSSIRRSFSIINGSKWLATVGSIWIQCTSGPSYCFGIYSSILKSSQGYDQSTLDSVAFFKDVGSNFGVLSGLLYASCSSSPRGGPWVVLLAGAVQCFPGYFCMWLAVAGAIPRPPVPAMCVFMFLTTHGMTFCNTANVVSAVENFSDHRGTVVGIMKGFAGLSGAILIQIYRAIFRGNPSSFLLMLALLPTLTPMLLMCFVKVRSTKDRHDKKYLNGFSAIAFVIAFFLMAVIIWENIQTLGSLVYILIFIILLLMLVSPLCLAIGAQLRSSRMLPESPSTEAIRLMGDPDILNATEQRTYERIDAEKLHTKHDHVVHHKSPSDASEESSSHDKRKLSRGENYSLSTEAIRLMGDTDILNATEQRTYERIDAEKLHTKRDHVVHHKTPSDASEKSSSHDKRKLSRGENYNLLQAIRTIDFWLLFLAMSCGMGSGLATVNNISQIGGSLGYGSTEISTLVSLWSIWNFLGRFGAGYVSEYFLHLKGYPRPVFIALALAAMSVGHAVIASGLPGALYAGSILLGVCYGSQWSLMPTITSEIFGVRHMGTIFNTITIGGPAGSYILSVRLVGYMYDMEASKSSEGTCTRKRCFMLSFIIMACVTLCGFAVAMCLFFRTRSFYKLVIFESLQRSAAH